MHEVQLSEPLRSTPRTAKKYQILVGLLLSRCIVRCSRFRSGWAVLSAQPQRKIMAP